MASIPPLTNFLAQELRLDGNWLRRVPSEALKGPTALQNLHLEDNVIGEEMRIDDDDVNDTD